MPERSNFAVAAELLTQALFFTQPWWTPRDVMRRMVQWWGGDPFAMLTGTTIVVLNLAWLVPMVSFYFIYKARHPFFERYKVQEWVWDKPQTVRSEQYYALIRKTVEKFVAVQIGGGLLVFFAFRHIMGDWTPAKYAEYLAATPDWFESTWKIFVGIALFETCFYWGHRFLHSKYGYRFHKDHHAYYTPVCIAGNWGHALDGLLSLPLPGIAPVFLLKMHIYTLWMWAIMHIFHSMYDHSGYDFPWTPIQLVPFGHHADAHNFHHSHNMDNYGLYWRFWDILLRTNKHWEAFRKQLREAEAAQAAQAAKGPVAGGAAADEWVVKDGRLFVKNVAEERDMKLGTDNLAYTIIQNQIDDPAKKTGQQVQLQQEPAPYVTLPVSKTSPTSATPSASASSSGVTRSRAKSNKAQ